MKDKSPDIDEPSDIDSLSPEQKRKLLADLLAKKARQVRYAPLSFAQQRLWFLDQYEPDSTAYSLYQALRLTGQLNHRALERGLNALVERHESLRTTFAMAEGQPVQVIAPSLILPLPVVDLQDLSAEEQETAIRQRIEEEASIPLALDAGPLIRATVLKVGPEEHVFLLNLHHIVSDDWSMGVLFRELAALYQAACEGQPFDLPPLPIQYADYTVWQRQWLQGEALERQLAYWREQLTDLPLLDFPTDHPRPPVVTHHGQRHAFTLSSTLLDGIKALSHQAGTTLFMTLLAAFHVLLARYSGQQDIAVGIPVANRSRQEIEGVIGFFVNTLVLRTDLSGNPSFRQVLQQVRERCLQAYSHQDVPFEKVVEELQLVRDPSRHPLFQIMFQVNQRSANIEFIPGLKCAYLVRDQIPAKFDLTLALTEGPEDLKGNVFFNTDLFEGETIARLSRHFAHLLASIVEDPDQRIGELSLVDDHERTRLLVEWNATQREHPKDSCIHQQFEAQVAATPGAVAVVFGEDSVTYGELNTRANHLAQYLHLQYGVGPEVCVGLCLERSVDMVVGMLGILKAGGAYVPLDPSYPQERLAFMLEDSQAPVLVTQQRLVEELPEHRAQVVCLDAGWEAIARERVENVVSGVTAEHLAYVLYTSGSTGRPKGVAIEHRSVVALLHWAKEAFGAEELRGVLASTSICFDLSVFELFVPLSWGGTAILAQNILALPVLPKAEEVTLVNTVPSGLTGLLRGTGLPTSVRTVNLAGEPLRPQLVREIQKAGTVEKVYDLYGPSEDTTYSTKALREAEGPEVIGRPIANTQVYLLDHYLEPVPIGVSGELYLGGEGLARGYYRRPILTAEKFIPNPFASKSGARLYRTGDVARYLPDGRIQYLGRVDHQVKVRGYRIELGEIEVALIELPAVKEAVVLVREDEPGEKRIVAYVVPAEQSESPSDLRQCLKQSLPEYMVPAAYVQLDQLPLTPNGKIDRPALPRPGYEDLSQPTRFVAARNEIEQTLVDIWSAILSLEQVGVHDDFFELGGHSLLATQVASRMNDAFGRTLPLRTLFENPTVAGLATVLRTQELEQASNSNLPTIQPVPRDNDLPLSFAQQRLWFLDQLGPGSPAYNLPMAARLKGSLNFAALEQSCQSLLGRHESLRTTFASVDGQPVQIIGAIARFHLPLVDLQHLPHAEREAHALQLAHDEGQRPFDLAVGPLLRITLVRLAPDEHVLLLTMHHIITDGWSTGILLRELSALYAAATQHHDCRLPELAIQYVDFAAWQQQWLQGDVLEKQLSYWREEFAHLPTALSLPTDRARPPIQTFSGDHRHFDVPPPLSAALKDLSQREGVTLFMTLLAAFQILLYRYSQQDDIVVGTPIANRNCSEIEDLIGFFVNTLVMRSNLAGEPSFLETLGQVKDKALAAYAHQDLPFEKLVQELEPERDLSRSPLFQVMFVFQNMPIQPLELTGVRVEVLPTAARTAKVDLTISLSETAEQIQGLIEYNTDLFEAPTIERLTEHFQILLQGIVADPATPISALPLLTPAENQQVMEHWNNTQAGFRDHTIVQLFEAQVAETPHAVALQNGEDKLTYAELNHCANQLAHYLIARDVGPEALVGLCVTRSTEAVIGMLGVLKAGGAYVPLDPAYPRERLAFMLDDTHASLLLTQHSLVANLPDHQAEVLCLDANWETVTAYADTTPDQRARPDDLAYVIYTSGSTGQPKGTLVRHQGLTNYVCWAKTHYVRDEHLAFPLFSSLAFDLTVTSIYTPLISGGRIVIYGEEGSADDLAIVDVISDNAVDVIKLTPAHLALIKDMHLAQSRLKRMIVGGEDFKRDLAKAISDRFNGELEIYNEYGPTEAVVGCMLHRFDPERDMQPSVPIGRPIVNVQLYILDRHLRPVPIGVPAELYVGGGVLARGYLNRPELTEERFIPNPFGREAGARLYKTGDIARYLPDGTLEFLGRVDDQVKLRGIRIELGEIEAVLGQHPGVRESVAVVREDEPGDKRVVAYVVPAEAPLSPPDLRQFLKRTLPEYMVPAHFVMLDALPLTPNGKVDRRSLPEPDGSLAGLIEHFVPPSTPMESTLAEIWKNVLRVEQVGVHDNFFELGGHSLLATRVVARIRKEFQVDLKLIRFFTMPTISELSKGLEGLLWINAGRPSEEEADSQEREDGFI